MGHARAAWHAWKACAHDIGQFQSRALLTVFYFTVFVPFAMVTRLFGDPLRLRLDGRKTDWSEWTAHDSSIEAARRQF
jgi:hypothetical protein